MTMGEVFLGAFLALLLEKLTSPELRDVARKRKVKKKMKKLERVLSEIQAVINDAEERQIRDMAVQKWLDELKYVAYDVEDILDELSTEALHLQLEDESQIGTVQVCRLLITSRRDVLLAYKIKNINKKLGKISKEKDDMGLREGVGGRSFGVTPRPPTTSSLNEASVFGREKDKETIIKFLLSDEPKRNEVSVIPIIGTSGLGKTTLAQLVYNDERVNQHFDLKAWAYVSGEFDLLKLTKAILESATRLSHNLNELDSLQVNLKKTLSTKKFLLVLDDVWNENYNEWRDLLTPLGWGVQGSKIIVTTRSETVSSIVRTVAAHHLEVLSDEDCLSIFKQHAFVDGTSNANPDLEIIGMEIVKKCKGSPLVAKTLGGLLRFKTDENEWKNIMTSEIWDLPEDREGILPSLRLSYHHLPAHLNRCFAYCSIFPKGYEFEKEKLVLLWMGEGFLQPKEGEQMEDIGAVCFDDLFHRSFFQPSSRNKSMFVMHDLMNDLAQSISRGICFRLEDKLEGNKKNNLEKARHSSYIRGRYDRITKFGAFNEAKYLRTFLPLTQPHTQDEYYSYLPKQVLEELFSKLRFLRVLCLSWHNITELPDSISKLTYLRYLNLSHTPIKMLPDSISALYNLQTLILIGCQNLSDLPNEMGKLINLRHLEIDGLQKMPLGIGRWTSLRKLSKFVVGENSSGASIKELGKLSYIGGNLCISNLENVNDVNDVLEAKLRKKKCLHGLELVWSNNFFQHGPAMSKDKDRLDGLHPPLNLKELTIKSYGGNTLPTWIGDSISLSNLVNLTIIGCRNCESLPPIGQLPSLKNLIISGMDGVRTVGHEFYGVGAVKPFPSLELLTFGFMSQLEIWLELVVFPCLHELKILNCPCLREIQPCFPTLVKLEIQDCEKLATFPSIVNTIDQSLGAEQGSSSMVCKVAHLSPTAEEGIHTSFVGKSKASEDISIPCRPEVIIKNCPSLQKLTPCLSSFGNTSDA